MSEEKYQCTRCGEVREMAAIAEDIKYVMEKSLTFDPASVVTENKDSLNLRCVVRPRSPIEAIYDLRPNTCEFIKCQ